MKSEIKKESGYYNLEDLKYAQKLSYAQRMEMLEQLNEFLMRAMPERNKRISIKLREMGF